jgi:hypothetical protein
MVEVVEVPAPVVQRKKLNRFTPWVNKLEVAEADSTKMKDVRQTVSKVEFNNAGAFRKFFDCRVLKSEVAVTKGYAERRKRDPIFDAFGIGSGDDAIKGNATINMLHRENVWHPYFEVQTEEEDLGTKMRNRQAESRKETKTEGMEISELKANLDMLEKNQREDNDAREQAAIGAPKKR